MDGTLRQLFSLSRPRTIGDELHLLAIKIQPVLAQKPSPERNRNLRTVRLDEFNRLLAQLCRTYCQRRGSRIEIEEFITEVQILTLTSLGTFDPQRASFNTWFSNQVLPRVYSGLQRSKNPSWGRPQPKTLTGQHARQTVLNLVQALPLESPDLAVDRNAPEIILLEAQCAEYFQAALAELSLADQVLLQRVYVFQEAQIDLAQSLGISPATVSVRLKKACRRLADLLGESFVEDCSGTNFCQPLLGDQP